MATWISTEHSWRRWSKATMSLRERRSACARCKAARSSSSERERAERLSGRDLLAELLQHLEDVRSLLCGGGFLIAPHDFAVLDEKGLSCREADDGNRLHS